MTKTAARRHQHYRHMRRRLAAPYWAWVETSPCLSDNDRAALRNRAARHAVVCSCYLCRCGRIDATAHKYAKVMEDW